MSDENEQGLLDAIREQPNDDTPRRVYADWLDDRNDPDAAARAEFIRVQIALAKNCDGQGNPLTETTREALRRREEELLAAHRTTWEQPLRKACSGIIEIDFANTGRFMFHAHQSEFTELGWMGFFDVVDR